MGALRAPIPSSHGEDKYIHTKTKIKSRGDPLFIGFTRKQ
jgi:hypothetical protein